MTNPFDGRNSAYYRPDGNGGLLDANGNAVHQYIWMWHGKWVSFVKSSGFSCVLGRSAMNRGFYRFALYPHINSRCIDALAYDLYEFVQEQPRIATGTQLAYSTFIAMFNNPIAANELVFENQLWTILCYLHEQDKKHHSWDPTTSSDPANPNFSFSFAERSFFVVGMHQKSSRYSRRFDKPCLVFNAHHQFEDLRTNGQMSNFQGIIGKKEIKLQGDINPNLANHGQDSEAKQYSCRCVKKAWKCPFP